MAAPQMALVDKAIAARDSALFATAFDALTNSCNACHKAMEHGYLVMKVPDANVASQYPDQEFGPAPAR
jgi:hypothetical protein